jgi:hypothetical protein
MNSESTPGLSTTTTNTADTSTTTTTATIAEKSEGLSFFWYFVIAANVLYLIGYVIY